MYRRLDKSLRKEDNQKFFDDVFNKDVIFLSTEDDNAVKVSKIKELLIQPPLYNFELSSINKNSSTPGYRMEYFPILDGFKFNIDENGFSSLVSVNNIDIIHPSAIPSEVFINKKKCLVNKIENCAFAN